METPVSRVVAHQRQVLGFMLDTLGLRHAPEEAARRARIDESERAVATLSAENLALRTENRALRSEVSELERELYPEAAEIDAWEREVDSRIAHEREAERI